MLQMIGMSVGALAIGLTAGNITGRAQAAEGIRQCRPAKTGFASQN